MAMRDPMDKKTFLNFYKNTVLGYSNSVQRSICSLLVKKNKITFEAQSSMADSIGIKYFESKNDIQKVISETTTDMEFAGFYEYWEFIKLYKYSVPLFYDLDNQKTFENILNEIGAKEFKSDDFCPELVLNASIKEAVPLYWRNNEEIFIKFVLQKTYVEPETFNRIDYRFPVIIYINTTNKILEVRYDSIKYNNNAVILKNFYEDMINECIDWMKTKLTIKLFLCNYADIIPVINDKKNENVWIYKQMMQMSTGASAELTASETADYVLPFIGELRELIEENEDLFNRADDVKRILLQYLTEKEETASYPYIYIKWVKPVESQSYVVKVIFDYFSQKYTILQHITGNCRNLEMERMNDAIEYLCQSRSFVKGEKI